MRVFFRLIAECASCIDSARLKVDPLFALMTPARLPHYRSIDIQINRTGRECDCDCLFEGVYKIQLLFGTATWTGYVSISVTNNDNNLFTFQLNLNVCVSLFLCKIEMPVLLSCVIAVADEQHHVGVSGEAEWRRRRHVYVFFICLFFFYWTTFSYLTQYFHIRMYLVLFIFWVWNICDRDYKCVYCSIPNNGYKHTRRARHPRKTKCSMAVLHKTAMWLGCAVAALLSLWVDDGRQDKIAVIAWH